MVHFIPAGIIVLSSGPVAGERHFHFAKLAFDCWKDVGATKSDIRQINLRSAMRQIDHGYTRERNKSYV